MARRVFFSFHYDRDIRRVVQVRNSWIVRAHGETQPFLDKADWESIKRRGDAAIEKWIEDQLHGTSVTAVLIGAETADRRWVRHEIRRSYELGKGIVGVYIHHVKDPNVGTDVAGANPLDYWKVKSNGIATPISRYYRTYDWVADNGYANFASWVESADQAAGR